MAEVCQRVERPPAVSTIGNKDWYVRIRPPEILSRRPSLGVTADQKALFQASVERHQGGLTSTLPEIFLAGFHHAKVHGGHYLMLNASDHVLFESAVSRMDYLEATGFLDSIRTPRPQKLAGTHTLLANRSVKGYYHWLIDILPKLSLLEPYSELASLPLIVPTSLQAYQTHSLNRLFPSSPRLTHLGAGFWDVDGLCFPEILGPTGVPSPHAIHWLRNKLGVVAPTSRKWPKRVYLTRRDASQRRVLNEEAVVKRLLAYGFTVVCPGDHTLDEQIELFQQAEVVIGPHGAGFTNIAFAPAKCVVVELFGDNYINGCFWAIANILGQKHGHVVGPSTWLDYRADPEHVARVLDQLGVL